VIRGLKRIVELIECDAEITLGHVHLIRKCMAMLVRRDGVALDDLRHRPDGAIANSCRIDALASNVSDESFGSTTVHKRSSGGGINSLDGNGFASLDLVASAVHASNRYGAGQTTSYDLCG